MATREWTPPPFVDRAEIVGAKYWPWIHPIAGDREETAKLARAAGEKAFYWFCVRMEEWAMLVLK